MHTALLRDEKWIFDVPKNALICYKIDQRLIALSRGVLFEYHQAVVPIC